MSDDTLTPNTLSYAASDEPAAIGQACRDDHGFRIDLGPMPTSIFIAVLLPHAICLGVIGFGVFDTFRRADGCYHWPMIALGLVAGTVLLAQVTRYRSVGRTVGGTAEQIYYSGPETWGDAVCIERATVESIGVRRSWWRPWVFELVAIRRKASSTLSGDSEKSVVLLLGVNHDAMARLAMELRDVPAAAAPPPPVLS
jgi:hypothetical protein